MTGNWDTEICDYERVFLVCDKDRDAKQDCLDCHSCSPPSFGCIGCGGGLHKKCIDSHKCRSEKKLLKISVDELEFLVERPRILLEELQSLKTFYHGVNTARHTAKVIKKCFDNGSDIGRHRKLAELSKFTVDELELSLDLLYSQLQSCSMERFKAYLCPIEMHYATGGDRLNRKYERKYEEQYKSKVNGQRTDTQHNSSETAEDKVENNSTAEVHVTDLPVFAMPELEVPTGEGELTNEITETNEMKVQDVLSSLPTNDNTINEIAQHLLQSKLPATEQASHEPEADRQSKEIATKIEGARRRRRRRDRQRRGIVDDGSEEADFPKNRIDWGGVLGDEWTPDFKKPKKNKECDPDYVEPDKRKWNEEFIANCRTVKIDYNRPEFRLENGEYPSLACQYVVTKEQALSHGPLDPKSQKLLDKHDFTKYKLLQCPICFGLANHIRSIKRHLDDHAGVKYMCPVCNKLLSQSSSLSSHLRTLHTKGGLQKIVCDLCGKSFNKAGYKNHYVRHLGLRNHPCGVCEKKFYSSKELADHMRIHTGAKPWTCEVCGKAFPQRSYLRIHARTHTEAKPYLCTKCGQGFRYSSCLYKHLKSRHGINIGGQLTVNKETYISARPSEKRKEVKKQVNNAEDSALTADNLNTVQTSEIENDVKSEASCDVPASAIDLFVPAKSFSLSICESVTDITSELPLQSSAA